MPLSAVVITCNAFYFSFSLFKLYMHYTFFVISFVIKKKKKKGFKSVPVL